MKQRKFIGIPRGGLYHTNNAIGAESIFGNESEMNEADFTGERGLLLKQPSNVGGSRE